MRRAESHDKAKWMESSDEIPKIGRDRYQNECGGKRKSGSRQEDMVSSDGELEVMGKSRSRVMTLV